MKDKLNDLFLNKEEIKRFRLINLEKKFIRNPKDLLYEMEVDFYNKLEELKEKKMAILAYREYIKSRK